jgi:hypothetical protein
MPTEKLNEQWWRDELYLTLNNWCYSLDIPPTAAVIQQNPNSYGIECAKCFVDIMVGSWDCENLNVRRDAPRVWMELKVRPTFWPPRKALYENDCTESDIRKLKRIPWTGDDVVLAVLIIFHESGPETCRPLKANWQLALDEIATNSPRFLPTKSIFVPCPDVSEKHVVHRYASIEFFTVHGQQFIHQT